MIHILEETNHTWISLFFILLLLFCVSAFYLNLIALMVNYVCNNFKESNHDEKQNIIKLLNKKIEENDKKIETNIPVKLSKEQEMFKIELEEENYIENMWNEYQITLNNIDIAEYEEYYIEKGLQTKDIEGNIMNFDIIKAKKMVRDLKSSIKDLGEVDTSIIKEYLNTKERYDYLLNQREDLESSKKSLEKIIKEIAFAMEEQFVSRMDIINKNFKEIFVTLFGGRKC